MVINPPAAAGAGRHGSLETALGLSGRPLPDSAAGGAVLTSQAVYGVAEYFYAGETITNIVACVTTVAAGAIPTFFKLGVWSSAATPVCLAITADLTALANWNALGYKSFALTAPLAITTSGVYYLAALQNGAFATPVQLATGGVASVFGGAVGAFPQRYGTLKTAAASMAVSDTGTYALSANVPWLGSS